MRLPAILAVMIVVLVAGVVSVRVLESRMGGATVPGIVVLDAPVLSHQALVAIQDRHPGSALESVSMGSEPLGPFDAELVDTLRGRGDETALFSLFRREDGVFRPTLWTTRRSVFPDPAFDEALREALGLLVKQRRTRAFFVALALPADVDTDGIAPTRKLVAVARDLPSFRRSSVVLLGAANPGAPGQRWTLRIDLGTWPRDPEPQLADLLSTRW